MNHRHFISHKPIGFLTQFKYFGKRASRKKLLGELHSFPEGTMAIGRLDKDSEGLLLLTTDGKESFRIRNKSIKKEYYAQVDGLIDQEAVNNMKEGVEIGFNGVKYTTLPCEAKILTEVPTFPPRTKRIRDDRHGPTSWVSITIGEGKNRQVRKMTAAVGFPTLRLIRVKIGDLELGNLPSGEVKEVPYLKV